MRKFGIWLVAIVKHWFQLASGAAVMTAIALFERYAHINVPRNIYTGVLVAFVGWAVFLAWRDQYEKADSDVPKFRLEVNQAFSHFEGGQTLIILGIRIVNGGAPSTVLGYGVKYIDPDGTQQGKLMLIRNIAGDVPVMFRLDNGATFSFDGKDAIFNRTNAPIPKGGFVSGRLPVIIEGEHHKDVSSGRAKLLVTVSDYLGKEYTEEFVGTGEGLPTYMAGEPIAPGNVTMTLGQLPPVAGFQQPHPTRRRKRKRK